MTCRLLKVVLLFPVWSCITTFQFSLPCLASAILLSVVFSSPSPQDSVSAIPKGHQNSKKLLLSVQEEEGVAMAYSRSSRLDPASSEYPHCPLLIAVKTVSQDSFTITAISRGDCNMLPLLTAKRIHVVHFKHDP